MLKIVKKIFFKKSEEKDENKKSNLALSLQKKSQELVDGISEKITLAKSEISLIKEKCGNLLETNYNLGLKHINNGNLSDAIFRFRFIIKFWPDHYDSYCQLAYCLILSKKPAKAKKVLENLMNKSPQHKEGRELLEMLNSANYSNQAFKAQE